MELAKCKQIDCSDFSTKQALSFSFRGLAINGAGSGMEVITVLRDISTEFPVALSKKQSKHNRFGTSWTNVVV